MRNPYEVLGVSPNDSDDEIKKAYRKLAMKYHPDRNGDAGSGDKFKEINQAYDAITKPKNNPNNGFGGGFGGGRQEFDMEDIFRQFFGDDVFGFGGGSRKKVFVINKTIDFKTALVGGEVVLNESMPLNCNDCSGTGAEGMQMETCDACQGKGNVYQVSMGFKVKAKCPYCKGAGQMPKNKCKTCDGKGGTMQKRETKFNLSGGVEDGAKFKFNIPDKMDEYDIVIQLNVSPHTVFKRQGQNIMMELPITFSQATLGASVKIPKIEGGEVSLEIPKGSQSESVLVCKGLGGVTGKNKRADMYVKIKVETPTNLNKEQIEILQKFEKSLGEDNFRQSKGFWKKIKDLF